MKIPIVVMASGQGTGFEAIERAVLRGELEAEIRAVVSDRESAPVLSKAQARGIPAIAVPVRGAKGAGGIESREEHDARVLERIEDFSPRFLVMSGYMRIVSPRLIEPFRSERGYSRVVNIHPSLLPSFPGMSAYAQAFRYGAALSGATVHLVEAQVDAGPICAQEAFSIRGFGSEAQVEEAGRAIEHRLYPETLEWVLPERFDVEERSGRLCVRSR